MLLLYHLLQWRLDFVAFLLLVVGSGWFSAVRMRRHGAGLRLSIRVWAVIGGFTIGSGLLAELMQRERVKELVTVFSGFGPTYAEELKRMGHARVTLTTPPDDPTYLQLIEAEKTWLRVNPLIADVYTFRHDEKGQLRLIVDSETDYDHNGRYEGEREQRTPIGEVYPDGTEKFHRVLRGTPEFESAIMPDRWGIWVSSFTPILDAAGHVEAAVGIDYPAADWLWAIARVRGVTLFSGLILIAIILITASAFTVVGAEIVERRQALVRLEAARESALMTSAAKSEFLAVTSHEVRTPLTAIMGFASILGETRLDETQRRYLDTIVTAGDRLMTLVNEILDFTKIEDGKMTLAHAPWSPALMVHEVMELISVRAQQKGLTLNFENKLSNSLTLLGDSNRVRQVLLNLMTNAVKFTEKGSVTVQAGWSQRGPGNAGQLVISVSDTGPGIAPDKIPLLFQSFTQIDPNSANSHGGSGLGLAICKRLVEMMGGKITVQSTPGFGTKFMFIVNCPVVPTAAPEQPLGQPENSQTAAPFVVGARALVVDDNRLNRELLKIIMQRQGFKVDVATGGSEGLGLALLSRYDVVLMDLEMPETDGFTATERLRGAEPLGVRVPIIAVTSLTAKGTRERCLQAGMDDYLTRPIYVPALRSALEMLLPPEKLSAPASAAQPLAAAT